MRPLAKIIGKALAAKRLSHLFQGRSLDSIAQTLHRLNQAEGYDLPQVTKRRFTAEEGAEAERLIKEIESKAHGWEPPKGLVEESSTVEGDKWVFDAKAYTRITSLEQLIEYCEIDQEVWEIERWTCNKWEVGAKGGANNQIEVTPLFQVKAFLRRRVQAIADREDFQWLIDECKAHAPVYFDLQRKPLGDDGHLAILNLTDIHFGKLCWAEEVGNDYDLKIAEQIWNLAVDDLLHKLSVFPIELMQIVIGHDLFNSDNILGTTTAGTPQDNDGRFHKVYRRVIQILIQTIDKCLSMGPVSVLFVPGNHDTLSCFTAGVALECFYHNAREITIDNSPDRRKYFEWQKNMFCHVHGDKINVDKLPLVMATEQPEMWGRTIYREAQTGDKHHFTAKDVMGTQVLKLPSLAGVDAYHHNNLYVGSRRSGIARVFHPEDGPVAQLMFNLNQARMIVKRQAA